jgi:hypothetical protein
MTFSGLASAVDTLPPDPAAYHLPASRANPVTLLGYADA